jgi:hypothetical protein
MYSHISQSYINTSTEEAQHNYNENETNWQASDSHKCKSIITRSDLCAVNIEFLYITYLDIYSCVIMYVECFDYSI